MSTRSDNQFSKYDLMALNGAQDQCLSCAVCLDAIKSSRPTLTLNQPDLPILVLCSHPQVLEYGSDPDFSRALDEMWTDAERKNDVESWKTLLLSEFINSDSGRTLGKLLGKEWTARYTISYAVRCRTTGSANMLRHCRHWTMTLLHKRSGVIAVGGVAQRQLGVTEQEDGTIRKYTRLGGVNILTTLAPAQWTEIDFSRYKLALEQLIAMNV